MTRTEMRASDFRDTASLRLLLMHCSFSTLYAIAWSVRVSSSSLDDSQSCQTITCENKPSLLF
jgi:hypothetical protein